MDIKDRIQKVKRLEAELIIEDIREQAIQDFPDGSASCPICYAMMEYHDYYGSISGGHPGTIYKCPNEGVCPSEEFNYFFHTWKDGDLEEGYPC